MSYPPEVDANLAFLKSRKIWHAVSENDPVVSCPDAASRRIRLGNRGIPLFDELKTNVGVCEDGSSVRYVAAHCRGHQRLDEGKLARVLGSEFRRLRPDELLEVLGAEKGLVNPFALAGKADIEQVFDRTVLESYFPPNTMMTNLGNFSYGVEFHAADLVSAIDRAAVADIIEDWGKRLPLNHRLGILTGNGPESGMLLWQGINARIRSHPSKMFRGDMSFPHVLVESIPEMGLSMELATRESAVRPVVLEGVRRLCDRGATIVGIACNTSQYFAQEAADVCGRYGARFVRTADDTAAHLQEAGIRAFDFFGIGAVLDFEKWSGFGTSLMQFEVKVPSESDREKISDLAYDIKKEGVTSRTINGLRDLSRRVAQTDVVVLALTELSVVYENQKTQKKSGKRFIDTLEILAHRMADLYVQEYVDVLHNPASDEETVVEGSLQ